MIGLRSDKKGRLSKEPLFIKFRILEWHILPNWPECPYKHIPHVFMLEDKRALMTWEWRSPSNKERFLDSPSCSTARIGEGKESFGIIVFITVRWSRNWSGLRYWSKEIWWGIQWSKENEWTLKSRWYLYLRWSCFMRPKSHHYLPLSLITSLTHSLMLLRLDWCVVWLGWLLKARWSYLGKLV